MRGYCGMNRARFSGKTRVCGIIGDPIEHSISPAMHNAAFEKTGLDYLYVPFQVRKEDLRQAIEGVRALNIRGLNVTIPHKVAVIPYLDEIDTLAEDIGAVNTIVNEDGYLKGYNTDATGFLQALKAFKIRPERKKVVILGAGGAARAISFILADRSSLLTLLNRHLSPAQKIADNLGNLFRTAVIAQELNRENLEAALSEADILVNTTSVGMKPFNNQSPVPVTLLSPNQVVFDAVYNPWKTKLLRGAEKRGVQVISGLEMLVWQGAKAFELWTGQPAPVEIMRETAIKVLSIKEKRPNLKIQS
jgi:shikimate dehydrogenase